MRFPSISHVVDNAKKSFTRFFLPLLIAITATVAIITVIENDDLENTWLTTVIYTCSLGLPLSIGCFLYAERSNAKYAKWIASLFVVVCMLLYGIFYAPKHPFEDFISTMIFFVLNIVVHLWVAFSPYVGKDDMKGFWRFNESIFIRVIVSAIFSAVLFGGLALAISAVDILFKYKVHDVLYGELWVTIVGVFNTWFILSGIPQNFEELSKEKEFPKGLKIFSQYILIPLATIYLLILYAYGIKIIVQWSLPKGWVSTLIMTYSVVGILAILLVNPLRDDKDNAWVRIFSRFFFTALLPLIVLLYVAIGTRVGQYGITELRYYLMVLGGWLAFISLYHIFSKKKNIKLIPVTLAILGLLTLWGPWSVFSVSRNSQVKRLEKILVNNEMWSEGGKIKEPKKELTKKDRQEIQGVIDYIVEHDRVSALQHIYEVDLEKLEKSLYKPDSLESNAYVSRYNSRSKMEDTLIAMLYVQPLNERWYYNSFYEAENDMIDIAGYNKLYYYIRNEYDEKDGKVVLPGNDTLKTALTNSIDKQYLEIEWGSGKSVIHLEPLVKYLADRAGAGKITTREMTLYADGDSSCKFIIKTIELNNNLDTDSDRIGRLEGYLMMK